MVVDRPQPAGRPGQEAQRRHDHQGETMVQAAQTGADQAHVVIQRQPAHEHIVGSGRHDRAHGAQVGQQVGVSQHHALGVTGAAGGVLQEGEIRAANRGVAP